MKRSVKAVLLSALVFPGAGHFYLKKRLRGMVLMVVSVGALCYVIFEIVQRAIVVCEMVIVDQIPMDLMAMTKMILNSSSRMETVLMSVMSWLIGVTWIAGIVDSLMIGRKLDGVNAEQPTSNGER